MKWNPLGGPFCRDSKHTTLSTALLVFMWLIVGCQNWWILYHVMTGAGEEDFNTLSIMRFLSRQKIGKITVFICVPSQKLSNYSGQDRTRNTSRLYFNTWRKEHVIYPGVEETDDSVSTYKPRSLLFVPLWRSSVCNIYYILWSHGSAVASSFPCRSGGRVHQPFQGIAFFFHRHQITDRGSAKLNLH